MGVSFHFWFNVASEKVTSSVTRPVGLDVFWYWSGGIETCWMKVTAPLKPLRFWFEYLAVATSGNGSVSVATSHLCQSTACRTYHRARTKGW